MINRLGSWGDERNNLVIIYGLEAQPTTQAIPSLHLVNPRYVVIEEEKKEVTIVEKVHCPYCDVPGEKMSICLRCGGTIGDD